MTSKTKSVRTTGDTVGFIVMVYGADNPAMLRIDERTNDRDGLSITKGKVKAGRTGGKAATIFETWHAANVAGKRFTKADDSVYLVFPCGHEDEDHVSL